MRGGKAPRGIWRGLTVVAASRAAIASTAVLANAGGGNGKGDQGLKLGHLGTPDLVLYDGRISTVDKRNSTVEAIAIRDGEIMATGTSKAVKKLAARGTKLVSLKGRRVLPGLIDGHLHGMREGYHCWTQGVRFDLVTRRATTLAMLRAQAGQLADGRWIWANGGGWNINQLDNPSAEPALLTPGDGFSRMLLREGVWRPVAAD